MISEREFQVMQSKIKQKQDELTMAKGKLEGMQLTLKTTFDCDTVELAESKISTMQKDVAVQEEQITAMEGNIKIKMAQLNL